MSEERLKSSLDEEKKNIIRTLNTYKYNQFLDKIVPNCFKMCVHNNPGQSLSHYEQNCIVRCTDLYVNSWIVTAKAFANRMEDDNKPYNVSDDKHE